MNDEHDEVAELPEVLTVSQAAELLGLSPRTVQDHAAEGKLPCQRIGGVWRFSRRAILEYLAGEAGSLTVAMAAKLLHISQRKVRELAARGELPGRKLGGTWRFGKAAILDHLAAG